MKKMNMKRNGILFAKETGHREEVPETGGLITSNSGDHCFEMAEELVSKTTLAGEK